jgi:DNA-directed RNA polymerase subunit F
MSKYLPLDAPITRREACTILDRKRFDAAVRAGDLVFSQQTVREYARMVSNHLADTAREHRDAAKDIAKRKPPLTRRQIATHLGKRQTGILIRGGVLTPYGSLTDTQTAAHTYDPADVAKAINDLADTQIAESRLLLRASKARVPA